MRGDTAKFNAQVALDFLNGKLGAVRQTVLLNAAGALVAAGNHEEVRHGSLADRLKGGYRVAEQAVDDGKALGILDAWRAETNA